MLNPSENLRVAGGLDRFFAELDEWADATAWPVTTHRYGPKPDHEADLRLPAARPPHPVAVVVHGGFWREQYTRRIMAASSIALAQAGWASWNVEYRRTGTGGGVPATLEDVSAAVAALDGLDTRLDRSTTVVVGHSAGGHLALWLAGTGLVSGAVSLAGVCDLNAAARDRLGAGAAVDFVGGTPDELPDAYALADLAPRLPAGVVQVLVHGERDDVVPLEQSRSFARRALASGDPCELVVLPDAGHFELIDPRSAAWPEVAAALARARS
ncbi:MAG: alpha/beta fold hydrolase [Actinomycetota bacterium]|nr:alpha/beta fold hydrolase [Actinomycetota bacterium]